MLKLDRFGFYSPVIALVCSVIFCNLSLAQEQPLVVDLEGIEWGAPAGGNGYPVGLQTARVGTDPATGGITYYARFPAGSRFDLHWHTHHEYVVVVKGEVTLQLGSEKNDLKVGSYVVIPGRLNHLWDVPEHTEVIILVRRAGPADFNFVEQ